MKTSTVKQKTSIIFLISVTVLCVLIFSVFPLNTLGYVWIITNNKMSFVYLALIIVLMFLYGTLKLFSGRILLMFYLWISCTAFFSISDLPASFGGPTARIFFIYTLAFLVGILLSEKHRRNVLISMFCTSLTILSVLYIIILINAVNSLLNISNVSSVSWGIFKNGRLHAFGNANTLGIYATVSTLESLWLFFIAKDLKNPLRLICRIILSLCGLLSILMLGLCRSRGSILATATGVGVMFFVFTRRQKEFWKPFLAAFIGACVSVLLCLSAGKAFDMILLKNVDTNTMAAEIEENITPVALDDSIGTLSDRTLIWSATIRMLDEEPMRWLTGITTANIHPNQIYDVYEGRPELTAYYAHSGYVEALLDYGLPGACILLIFLIEVIITCIRVVFSASIKISDKAVIGFIAAALVLGVVEVLPFPYKSMYILSFMFYFASGCCINLSESLPPLRWLKPARAVVYCSLAVVAIILCFSKLSAREPVPTETKQRIEYFNDKNRKSISVSNIDFALEDIADIFNGKVLESLIKETAPEDRFDNIDIENIPRTVECRFGVSILRTNLYKLPIETDDKDMLQSDVLPFTAFIELYDSTDGEWTYVLTYGYGGWVRKEAIALCENKGDWLQRIHPKDFLVVTDYDIHLDDSRFTDISVPMGTVLPLISESNDSSSEGNDYIITLPTRDANGYIEDVNLHLHPSAGISHGYLPFSEENIRLLAGRHEGHIYGWAGANNAFDCSGMTKSVYACFGINLPRSASAQASVKAAEIYNVHNDFGLGHVFNVLHNTIRYKLNVLKDAPVGTLLYFPGHVMIYLGMENDHPICISSVGDYSTTDLPAGTIVDVNETVVTDMTYVTRANGKTWLENLEKIVIIY